MRQDGAGLVRAGVVGGRLFLPNFAWLFCYIGKSLGLFSIAVFNIVTNSSAYCFKLDISNLYSSLSFYHKLSMNMIFAFHLTNFNFYFYRNFSSSIQSSEQV